MPRLGEGPVSFRLRLSAYLTPVPAAAVSNDIRDDDEAPADMERLACGEQDIGGQRLAIHEREAGHAGLRIREIVDTKCSGAKWI
jgi:hypothetical protein